MRNGNTVEPLKTSTPWGMKKWPSYRVGRHRIDVISLRQLCIRVLERFYCRQFFYLHWLNKEDGNPA